MADLRHSNLKENAVTRIPSHDGDGYLQALKALVAEAQRYLQHEDPDLDDLQPLQRHANEVARELRDFDYRPRQRMTRADVHRNALLRLTRAVGEYGELEDYDGGALGLNVWEAFERSVRSAAASARDDGGWAPEDDTNPIKVSEVPTPDPDAEPINGIRQGEWVQASWEDTPRQVLAGVNEDGCVRLSDPRDGGGLFGGYFVQASMLGESHTKVEVAA